MIKKYVLGLAIIATSLAAQAQLVEAPAQPVICYTSEAGGLPPLPVLPAAQARLGEQKATMQFMPLFDSTVPDDARPAIEKALGIWAGYLASPMTVRVKVTWESLPSTVLAQTAASAVYRGFAEAPYKEVWYPTPLAEALAGRDLNSGKEDIVLKLNKDLPWSYSTTGQRVLSRFDMATVVLHELTHGLAFTSSFNINSSGQGTWGQSGYPYIYDTFVYHNRSLKLTDTKVIGSPSETLKTYLTSNAVFFDLRPINRTSQWARLHAPSEYQAGGSTSHLDEATYFSGTPNSLMTPNLRSAEVVLTPGNVILQMMYRMGWVVPDMALESGVVLGNEPQPRFEVLLYPNPATDIITLAFPLADRRMVAYRLIDLQGKELLHKTTELSGAENFRLDASALPEGSYILQVTDGGRSSSHRLRVVR